MNGVINIYKEKGYSSFHVIYVLRRITGEPKAGHTGTLDPDVTGVLPVCLGKATKLVGQLTDTDKTYTCCMLLGKQTDTQDTAGEVLWEMPANDIRTRLTEQAGLNGCGDVPELLARTLQSFEGEIDQVPPMYSALKVDGVKLVNAARKGVEIARNPRKITIYSIQDISVSDDWLHIRFTVHCSKGTYVRTLCEDAGARLRIPACMESLERICASGLDLSTAITLDQAREFAEQGTLEDHLIPADRFLTVYPAAAVKQQSVRRLVYGNYLFRKDLAGEQPDLRQSEDGQIFRIYDESGEFYALYRLDRKAGCLKCVKMFHDIVDTVTETVTDTAVDVPADTAADTAVDTGTDTAVNTGADTAANIAEHTAADIVTDENTERSDESETS